MFEDVRAENDNRSEMMKRRERFMDILMSETEANFSRSHQMVLDHLETNFSDQQRAQAEEYLATGTPFYVKEQGQGEAPADRHQSIYIFSGSDQDAGFVAPRVDRLYDNLLSSGLIDEVPKEMERLQLEAWLDTLGFERIEPVQWEERSEAA